jgi:hypothetical protein
MLGRRLAAVRSGLLKGQLAVLLLLISAIGASACPLCYEAARQMMTEGVQLDAADRAVLATPVGTTNQFRVVAVIKGEDAVGELIADPVAGVADTARDPSLLIRDPAASQWTGLGTIPVEDADWLRQVAATRQIVGNHPRVTWPVMPTADTLSYAGWRRRIALVLPCLESPNQLVARLAWGELARAPYAVMDVARSRIDGATVAGWLNDPKLASRHAAYTTLLGFVGGPAETTWLEQQLEATWNVHDTTNLATMIGADLELRGPSRVGWVESMYFADRSRTMPEIEAALLALNVHGDADRTVPRERVIQAYRLFIKERPQMAGFVAPQLADWGYWDAMPEYAALLKANVIQDPASQLAVASYIERGTAAEAALESISR